MKKKLSVGEAAKAVGATPETLRHYDRIGLVRPSFRDEDNGYRLYTPEDLVRLSTALALRGLNLSTEKAREILGMQDLSKVISLLKEAEARNSEQMRQLLECQTRIQRAVAHYETLQGVRTDASANADAGIRQMDARVLLLAEADLQPTLDTLWNYPRHFQTQLGDARMAEYRFRDVAGILYGSGSPRMFAECAAHGSYGPLARIPGGAYRCRRCRREELAAHVEQCANADPPPAFCLAYVVLDGVLHWHYELQVPAQGQLAEPLA